MDGLRRLQPSAMLALAEAIERGRVHAPFDSLGIGELVSSAHAGHVAVELRALDGDGMAARHVAQVLRALAAERADAEAIADRFELVWSGDEDAAETRSTSVVVQQLFAEAQRCLIMASYALEQGPAAHELFGQLAARMDAEPQLSVRFFINVERKYGGDSRPDEELLREYAATFKTKIWPGTRLPEVFYDPRALQLGPQRACLHAKCVVADERAAFLTSANFTEAAQERNYEAGLLLRDARLAAALQRQFEGLIARARLRRLSL